MTTTRTTTTTITATTIINYINICHCHHQIIKTISPKLLLMQCTTFYVCAYHHSLASGNLVGGILHGLASIGAPTNGTLVQADAAERPHLDGVVARAAVEGQTSSRDHEHLIYNAQVELGEFCKQDAEFSSQPLLFAWLLATIIATSSSSSAPLLPNQQSACDTMRSFQGCQGDSLLA